MPEQVWLAGQSLHCWVAQLPLPSHFCWRYFLELEHDGPEPQLVVLGWLPLSVHTAVPVAQEYVPVLQGLGGWHEPPPWQVQAPAVVQKRLLLGLQLAPADESWQVPPAAHTPVWQLEVPPQAESATPAFLVVHAEPSAAQAWQAFEHALAQQTLPVPAALSTHAPAAQSAVLVQAAPWTFLVPQAVPPAAQAVELGHALEVGTQVCEAVTHALWVKVEPEQESAAQLVPPAV